MREGHSQLGRRQRWLAGRSSVLQPNQRASVQGNLNQPSRRSLKAGIEVTAHFLDEIKIEGPTSDESIDKL
jgi:hypothetical protein